MLKVLPIILHGVSGIYAGACVAIAAVDLRFIRSVTDPALELASSRALLGNMGTLMAPQLVVMLALCLALSIAALRRRASLRSHAPLLVLAAILGVTAAVHLPINAAIFSGEVLAADISALMARWEAWHWLRTALALALPAALIWAKPRSPAEARHTL